ncbi:stage V sporulation protein AB [Paenibacillus yanchengensis]|uniref:Stage V sporulation protein AB n=1 Tax=Paenibacillus yanchengensis TaxID=2035833 RepID=A0ABW4YK17_9BACL
MNATIVAIGGKLLIVLIGFSGGIAVGSGLVALLIVFDLIPRLAQLARAFHMSAWFESAIISGTLFWTIADFIDFKIGLPSQLLQSFVGILAGIFVGMLAAALTEVMNVIPIYAKRLKLSDYMIALVMAMVLGKIIGSLFNWLVM